MKSLAIAATGMNAQQLNIETIANNIANINTTSFKRARAEFTDLFYQMDRMQGVPNVQGFSPIPEGANLGLGVRSAAVRNALLEALQSGVVTDDSAPVTPGVALVGGGPGDPDLITVRGRRLLARANLVVADRLAPPELLAELGPEVEVIDAAKIPYGRAMAQEHINAALIEGAKAGKFVVRLKGGDNYVFGRGYEELEACVDAGIPVTVVPGVTSAISVPALAGIPVTHRGVTHEFVVVSGHVAPEHPDSLVDWPALARLRGTLVLLMAVERIEKFADALMSGGRAADTAVTVIQEGSLRTQRILRADLATVAERVRAEGVRPPAIIVIGPTAGFTAGAPDPRS